MMQKKMKAPAIAGVFPRRMGSAAYLCAAAMGLGVAAPARSDDMADLKAQIRTLTDKIDALERANDQARAAKPPQTTQPITSVNPNGSVTVYANLDASTYVHRSGGKSTWGFDSAAVTTSSLGFKGERTLPMLGDGVLGFFNYRENLNLLTGGTGSGITGATTTGFNNFNGAAYVGVSGPFGTVTAGRQAAPSFSTSVQIDSFQIPSLGIALQYANSNLANITSPLTSLTVPAFSNTSGGAGFVAAYVGGISYATPTIGGFQARVLTTVGNGLVGAKRSDNSLWDVSLSYRGQGIDANYAHNLINSRTTANATTGIYPQVIRYTKTDLVGVGYTWSGVRFSTSYYKTTYDASLRNVNATTGIHDNQAYSVGALATTGPWKYGLEYTRAKDVIDKRNENQIYGLIGRYSLDATSEVYSLLGFVKNKGNAAYQPVWSAANLVCTPSTPKNALSTCGKGDTSIVFGYRESF